jgi:hypothetical protein
VNFFFGKNKFRRAFEKGFTNNCIEDALKELDDAPPKSRADAEAICWALEQIQSHPAPTIAKNAYAVARLFQEIEDAECAAIPVLCEQGIPLLVTIFDQVHALGRDEDVDCLLFVLKILAMYPTTAGTFKIIEAANKPIKPEGYMWSVILANFGAGHPEAELLFRTLSNPLPTGFVAVSLLDAANACLLAEAVFAHPFDSKEGKERLKSWLTQTDPEKFSYAHSATAALPFISNPERDALLDHAMQHSDRGVQMEAAWAAAKLGREEGFRRLTAQCLSIHNSRKAKHYLVELNREDLIPAKANAPDFSALAEFSEWLAHPNELGRVADCLEIVDHRELPWPPGREPKPFWLIRFVARGESVLDADDEGCGLVGSITFSMFSYNLHERPPEDGYAIHCYWEMQHQKLIEESDVEDPAEYSSLLQQWHGKALENPQLSVVAELSPELRYPQRLVGAAAARMNGVEGWVVLDGESSEWFARADMPDDTDEKTVLKIHVGRRLLGLTAQGDRQKYLATAPIPKPPAEIIGAYEKLLVETKAKSGKEREDAFGMFRPLSKHLQRYVDALVQTGRVAEIVPVVDLFEPYSNHCSGYTNLSSAAYKCGQMELAERLLLKTREECAHWERGDEMGRLAEIWSKQGRTEEARALLIECLQRLSDQSKTAKGSDKKLYEKWFQNQRSAYLTLFPGEADKLAAHGLPDSTLQLAE